MFYFTMASIDLAQALSLIKSSFFSCFSGFYLNYERRILSQSVEEAEPEELLSWNIKVINGDICYKMCKEKYQGEYDLHRSNFN